MEVAHSALLMKITVQNMLITGGSVTMLTHQMGLLPVIEWKLTLTINRTGVHWKENGNEKELRKLLIPIEYAIMNVKRVFVKDSTVNSVTNGSPVYAAGVSSVQDGIIRGETIALYSLKEELVAIGIAKMTSEEMVKAKKGTAVRTDRVFIGRDVYPKT